MDHFFVRLRALFGRGRVSYVNDGGTVQTMQVRMNDLSIFDNRVRLAEFGLSSNPPVGSDVLVLHVAGDVASGAVFATNHQASRPTGLQSGETMLYCLDGKQIYLTAGGGIVVEAKGQAVTVNDATTVTINAATEIVMDTPLLKVTGDILDNCASNTDTVAGMRRVANGHTHTVTGVQAGNSTVNSNPPTQPE